MGWLKYLSLAISVAAAIPEIQALTTSAAPLTGLEIESAVQPVVASVNSIFPNAKISMALLTDCASAVADTINQYKLKQTAPPVPALP